MIYNIIKMDFTEFEDDYEERPKTGKKSSVQYSELQIMKKD